ncbi:MAG: hypothetical protein ACLSAC_03860 [Enterocloster bolteae]
MEKLHRFIQYIKSALTSELNGIIILTIDGSYNFQYQFYDTFEDLFYNHSIIINDQVLKQYSKEWKKPAVQRDLERYDSLVNETDRVGGFEPRGAQIEALYALKMQPQGRGEEGFGLCGHRYRKDVFGSF